MIDLSCFEIEEIYEDPAKLIKYLLDPPDHIIELAISKFPSSILHINNPKKNHIILAIQYDFELMSSCANELLDMLSDIDQIILFKSDHYGFLTNCNKLKNIYPTTQLEILNTSFDYIKYIRYHLKEDDIINILEHFSNHKDSKIFTKVFFNWIEKNQITEKIKDYLLIKNILE